MKKVLIVGQAPSRTCSVPFAGRSGARLAELAGMTHAEFLRRTERVNLIDRYLGKSGKGDRAPRRLLDLGARRLVLSGAMKGRKVLLVGAAVTRAVFRNFEKYMYGLPIYSIPHPSGVNRAWNDPQTEIAVKVIMEVIFRRRRKQ
jgi:uracil-DNA glycosylase